MQQIVEGAYLVLISSAIPLLLITLLWLPEGASDSNVLKFSILAVACTSWTLLWSGAWKLSAPSPDSCANRGDVFWSKTLRAASPIMLFFPVPWGIAAMGRKVGYWDWELTYLQLFFFVGVASVAIFYQNLRQLMSRAGARLLQGAIYSSLAGVIFVQCLYTVDVWDFFEHQPSSLTFMCFCPSVILGPQIAPLLLVSALREHGTDGWPIPTAAASIVLCAITMIFAAVVLRSRYHTCQKMEIRLLRRRRTSFNHLG